MVENTGDEDTKGRVWYIRIAHAPLKSVPGAYPLPLRRSGENKKKSERKRDGTRDRVDRGGEVEQRETRRRQLGQTLNNLDNGRTALNSCRFVQAHRLIRLAGRLQRRGRSGEWVEVPVNFRCLPGGFPTGLSPPPSPLSLSFYPLYISIQSPSLSFNLFLSYPFDA